ncbi:tRNA lysidine(34) synthetase TilS [Candidatus Tisiphia endosymbiont of Oplodontha viridula]|uniref:tRNA lysidine(34) synthetase TilS n=1 Tax=Candidatus Tisiphia endosymbiont of Oplodontha viridula TaxID=3077925 RepID=UPI0035C895D9
MLYQQFQQNIEKLIGNRPRVRSIALAVSGGSDSIALLMLTHKWVCTNSINKNINVVVMLVDHHLREQSKLEHEYVRDLSHKLGHTYHLLHFDHQNNFSNLQARAREGRYQLMTDLCRKLDILTILTAHHLDDYIENYCLRSEKKSSIFGLSGSNINWYNNVRIVRPLFNIPKQQLVTYLITNNIKWFEDESNKSDKYQRNIIRKKLSQQGEYVKNQIISEQSTINQLVEEKLQPELIACIAESVKIYQFGFATINLLKVIEFSNEIILQLISFVLIIISGRNRSSRTSGVSRIMVLLQQQMDFTKTLHGCVIKRTSNNLIIYREFGRSLPMDIKLNNVYSNDLENWNVKQGVSGLGVDELREYANAPKFYGANSSKQKSIDVWDGRFRFAGSFTNNSDYLISNLTIENYSKIKQDLDLTILKNTSFNNHVAILFTLPVVKILEKVIAIPHISYYNGNGLREGLDVSFSPNFISRFTHFC